MSPVGDLGRDSTALVVPDELEGISHVIFVHRAGVLGYKATTIYRDVELGRVWLVDSTNPAWQGSDEEAVWALLDVIQGEGDLGADCTADTARALLVSRKPENPPQGVEVVTLLARLRTDVEERNTELRWVATRDRCFVLGVDDEVLAIDYDELLDLADAALDCGFGAVEQET